MLPPSTAPIAKPATAEPQSAKATSKVGSLASFWEKKDSVSALATPKQAVAPTAASEPATSKPKFSGHYVRCDAPSLVP